VSVILKATLGVQNHSKKSVTICVERLGYRVFLFLSFSFPRRQKMKKKQGTIRYVPKSESNNKIDKNQSKLTLQCSRDIISKSLQRSRLILKCNPRSVCFDLQTTQTHAWCH